MRMPFSSLYGGFWFEGGTNRGIVQRTFGLNAFLASKAHVVSRSADAKAQEAAIQSLTYGPKFRYAEYMVVGSSWLGTAVVSVVITLLLKLLWHSSLVRPYAHLVPSSLLTRLLGPWDREAFRTEVRRRPVGRVR